MLKGIDHIGILVADLDEALKLYRDVLGLKTDEPVELPEQMARVAFVHTPNGKIELLQPTSTDSQLSKTLEKRGEGLLHICFEVSDINGELRALEAKGVRLVDEVAWQSPHGLAAFLHPKSLHGVSIELREHKGATRSGTS